MCFVHQNLHPNSHGRKPSYNSFQTGPPDVIAVSSVALLLAQQRSKLTASTLFADHVESTAVLENHRTKNSPTMACAEHSGDAWHLPDLVCFPSSWATW
jgi:hypothetical protein